MSKFAEIYKDTIMPSLPLYGLGEIVSYAGFRWGIAGFKPNHTEGCWIYNLKKVDGSDETETGVYELGLSKGYQMEKSTEGMNNQEKMKYYMQKLGISDAGSIPNTLLARQDLEGAYSEKMRKSGNDIFSFSVWYYDPKGNRKCEAYNNFIEAEAFANLVETMGFKDVKILKGQVETTGKQLEAAAAKAEDSETSEEKSLIQNIKAIQIKRQKATLVARAKETTKSFKKVWEDISRSSN